LPLAEGAGGIEVARYTLGRAAVPAPELGGGVTGGVDADDTTTVATAVADPLDALTLAVPNPTAATSPVAETVAMRRSLEDHVTDSFGSGLPVPSRTTAVSCSVCPTARAGVFALSTMTRTVGDSCNDVRRPNGSLQATDKAART
jgi:hypothetical protein